MKARIVLILALVMLAVASAPVTAKAQDLSPMDGGPVPASNLQGKKLIRWAAELTNKTPASEVPGKVKAWQQAGYDGLCFNISSHRDGSEPQALHEAQMFFRWWSLITRTREEFAPDIQAFKSVEDWGRLTDNFLLTGVRPLYTEAERATGKERCPDWFKDEDFEIVLSNARLAAGIAREIGFRGIVLDTEAYGWATKGAWSAPWSYPGYKSGWYKSCGHAEPLPFVEVAAKVRQRGRDYAQALSETFPEIVLLVAPGLYEAAWEGAAGKTLAESQNALWPAFVDGILMGLSEQGLLVSLNESTYVMSQYTHLATRRDIAKEQALVTSTVPEIARQRISFSAGLWTDAAYGSTGSFSNTDPEANHRNPERHEHATANALAVSDHYAWHYGEASFFLQWGEGYPFKSGFDKRYQTPPPLIRAYWRANERAHEPHDLDWAPDPTFDTSDYTQFNTDASKRNQAFWEAKEKEGYEVALKLPEYWRFLYDQERLGRFRPYPKFLNAWAGHSWFQVSSKKCWQSQGIRVNGYAWYGTTFDVPADLDVDSRELFLTFSVYGSGAVNIYLNGGWIGYLPKNPMTDVTKNLKPGEKNILVLGFLNENGPGGLAGDVKILTRKKD
ncbi:MAG: hypothetical protein V2A58_08750 [Planctomycetota bacterium]